MPGVCVGRIAEIDAQGRPWVDFPGNIAGPRLARVLGRVAPDDLRTLHRRGAEVLLGFENGEARLPILIAVTLLPTASPEVSGTSLTEAKARTPEASPATTLRVDGQRFILEAERELELRCGEASILLRRDGTIKIRGRDITTWARRRQRIRGGSVSIN